MTALLPILAVSVAIEAVNRAAIRAASRQPTCGPAGEQVPPTIRSTGHRFT